MKKTINYSTMFLAVFSGLILYSLIFESIDTTKIIALTISIILALILNLKR